METSQRDDDKSDRSTGGIGSTGAGTAGIKQGKQFVDPCNVEDTRVDRLVEELNSYRDEIQRRLDYGKENFMQEYRFIQMNWKRQIELIDELVDYMEEGDPV